MTDDTLARPDSLTRAPESPAPWRLSGRDRLVIGLLLVSAFVVILNETIMGVALPQLIDDLGITAAVAQWLTTGFLLTMAVVIPVTGFLLQRLSTRQVFVAAMGLFALGTLVSFAAPGFEVLLVGRIVQASGTAIMLPLLMTTLMTIVPTSARGRTMGNVSIVISVAPAIGPTISGLILSVLEWRWMFGIVLPIALLALGLGIWKVPNVTEPRRLRLDLLSVVISAFAFGGLVFGLSSLGEGGESGVPAWTAVAVGAVALALFVWRQLRLQRRDAALLDLRTFRTGAFTIATVVLGLNMVALFGTVIVLPLYLQGVLGLDTLGTGLLLLPGGLVMGLLAPIVGRLYDRVGPRPLLVPGAVVVSATLWGMTLLGAGSPIWAVLIAHVGLSVGLALTFTPLFSAGLGSVESRLYSHASAIVNTVQQVMGAAGTALFVAVMSLGIAAAAGGGAEPIQAEAAGIRAAFIVGALISLVAVAASVFLRRPAGRLGAAHGGR